MNEKKINEYSISKESEKEFFEANLINFFDIDEKLFKKFEEKNIDNKSINSKPYSYWKSVFKILFKSPTFWISSFFIAAIILLAVFVPMFTKYDSHSSNESHAKGMSWEHWFGVNGSGADYWTIIWYATSKTLLFVLILSVLQISTGIIIGAVWGYFRKTDIFFIQLSTFLSTIPNLILLLLIIFLTSSKANGNKINMGWVIFGICLQGWIYIASIVRAQVLIAKTADYNVASITLGSGPIYIITRNIIPKILPSVVQAASFTIPTAISIDASLSFLGFAFESHTTGGGLGKILNEVMSTSEWQVYPHLIIIPIFLTTMISVFFFLISKEFADSLNPKNHR